MNKSNWKDQFKHYLSEYEKHYLRYYLYEITRITPPLIHKSIT